MRAFTHLDELLEHAAGITLLEQRHPPTGNRSGQGDVAVRDVHAVKACKFSALSGGAPPSASRATRGEGLITLCNTIRLQRRNTLLEWCCVALHFGRFWQLQHVAPRCITLHVAKSRQRIAGSFAH